MCLHALFLKSRLTENWDNLFILFCSKIVSFDTLNYICTLRLNLIMIIRYAHVYIKYYNHMTFANKVCLIHDDLLL